MRHTWIYVAVLTVLGGLNTLGLAEATRSQGRRNQRKQKENPIDKITAAPDLNLHQMAGKWYLISVASKCPYLLETGFKVESTIISLTPPSDTDAPMLVSTFRKLPGNRLRTYVVTSSGYGASTERRGSARTGVIVFTDTRGISGNNQQCWEIKQEYETTKTKGRLLVSNKNPRKNIDIVIADIDHSSYAMLYYQRHGKISLKLYGRSPKVPDSIADKFEELAAKESLGLDYVFQFPDYSFCESTDKDYVLGESED